jgi:hypothetical protein
VQLVLCVTLLAVYQYHRLKTLPAFGKHLKIEDQGEVNSFFSRKSLHACGRFLLRLIPYVEVDDRRTRQDLIQVFIDFNRGSLPSEQASFVLSKHFDLKKADIEELLDIK